MNETKYYVASDSLKESIKGIERRLKRIEPYCQKSENFDQHMSIIRHYLSSVQWVANDLKKAGM